MKILIIDDSKSIRALASSILSKEHTVFVAKDWAEANSYIFRQKVDLILMDVEMPGIKGDQIAKIIKDTTLNKVTPPKIVLFSSLNESILQNKCLECGLDGYIHKKNIQEDLMEQVQRFL